MDAASFLVGFVCGVTGGMIALYVWWMHDFAEWASHR